VLSVAHGTSEDFIINLPFVIAVEPLYLHAGSIGPPFGNGKYQMENAFPFDIAIY